VLEFNLSQFKDPDDLMAPTTRCGMPCSPAETPVVFWDEFDSRNYYWLQIPAGADAGRRVSRKGNCDDAIGKCVFGFRRWQRVATSRISVRPVRRTTTSSWRRGPDFRALAGFLDVLGRESKAVLTTTKPRRALARTRGRTTLRIWISPCGGRSCSVRCWGVGQQDRARHRPRGC